jgi:hypothetical protein
MNASNLSTGVAVQLGLESDENTKTFDIHYPPTER